MKKILSDNQISLIRSTIEGALVELNYDVQVTIKEVEHLSTSNYLLIESRPIEMSGTYVRVNITTYRPSISVDDTGAVGIFEEICLRCETATGAFKRFKLFDFFCVCDIPNDTVTGYKITYPENTRTDINPALKLHTVFVDYHQKGDLESGLDEGWSSWALGEKCLNVGTVTNLERLNNPTGVRITFDSGEVIENFNVNQFNYKKL